NATSALPLKVPATPSRATDSDKDKTPMASSKQGAAAKAVENLLEQLDSKFDEMSKQILDRMTDMSSRVDALEASIQDIINGDITNVPSVPQSPSPMPVPGMRRSESGPQ
ncbi:hypothetical protein BDQ17DRAFT_1350666, partial [Cyathus striatus]